MLPEDEEAFEEGEGAAEVAAVFGDAEFDVFPKDGIVWFIAEAVEGVSAEVPALGLEGGDAFAHAGVAALVGEEG